jgi:hypothetical protein
MSKRNLLVEISTLLGGYAHGEGYSMPCPICKSEKPSLSIWPTEDGAIGMKCHYSAGHSCHPIALVYTLQSMGVDISTEDLKRGRGKVSETWLEIWNNAEPVEDTHTHDYLLSRKIPFANFTSLRNMRYFKHPAGGRHPCMLALVTNPVTHVPVALHRTYLNAMGTGKADVVPNKMTLGSYDGGVVELFEPKNGVIAIGEGIETCLSYTAMHGTPTWCSVSAGNTSKLRIPFTIKHVILLKDNDIMGERSTNAAAEVIEDQGPTVAITAPPRPFKDFNNELMAREV